jgi:micrococcal nuclease
LVVAALLALWSLRPSRPTFQAPRPTETPTPPQLPLLEPTIPPPTPASTPDIEPAEGCDIKGNISKKGEKIYHLPGQNFYERTVISPEDGERWFCTEAEAEAAGWRKSKV